MNSHALTSALEVAKDVLHKGYGCVPVRPGTKVPAIPWRRFQSAPPTLFELPHLFADTRGNIALLTSGLVVFDCDDPTLVERVLAESGPTPYHVRTPRGGRHLGYRAPVDVALTNRVRVHGWPLDLRTTGGLVLLPPSRTEHGEYTWIGDGLPPRAALPVARIDWTKNRERRRIATVVTSEWTDRVQRARAYLAKVEPAVSGHRGHDRCFRAACVLVQKFGLDFDEAWGPLVEWNLRNVPPFIARELEHKLHDAVAAAQTVPAPHTGPA